VKRIWLGPVLGTTRERLISRCLDELKVTELKTGQSAPNDLLVSQTRMAAASAPGAGLSDYKFLYLAASRPLLNIVIERLIEDSTNTGLWGPIPVHLFRGFVSRVLASAVDESTGMPLVPRTPIDREEFPAKRSLLSRIMKAQTQAGQINRIAPLSAHDGCINSVSSLLGEIERAGLDAAGLEAVLASRAPSFNERATADAPTPAIGQVEIDREIWSIYDAYETALTAFDLTEEDADQLRALNVLRGELGGRSVQVPWLAGLRLLILDGFFDFTPIQGEIIRLLVSRVPDVIVNFNWDLRNSQIFRPFQETMDRLCSMAEFEVEVFENARPVARALAPLRERLFKGYDDIVQPQSVPSADAPEQLSLFDGDAFQEGSDQAGADWKIHGPDGAEPEERLELPLGRIRLFECDDRLTEIRTIAKEIKRLVIERGYSPSDICVVMRELALYSDTIIRVFEEESIPHTLERRTGLVEIPSARAAIKLLQIIGRGGRGQGDSEIAISMVADIVKSGYFRLSSGELGALGMDYGPRHAGTGLTAETQRAQSGRGEDESSGHLTTPGAPLDASPDSGPEPGVEDHLAATGKESGSPTGFRQARWAPDEIENVIAYVGGELGVGEWLARARYLTESLAAGNSSTTLRTSQTPPETSPESWIDRVGPADVSKLIPADQEPDSIFPPESGMIESRIRPSTRVEPAAIRRSALVVERIAELIRALPAEDSPGPLCSRIRELFKALRLPSQINGAIRRQSSPEGLARGALDLRAMEGVRRAMVAAVEAVMIAEPKPGRAIPATELIEEILRCMRSQVLRVSGGSEDGVRILEATDLRGLTFRGIFVAGLVEGEFPLRPSRDWIYPQEQREQLKEYGLSLEDISAETLLKEEHYFYQVVCRATELLYLSRPLISSDGLAAVTSRSYYIEELKRAVHPVEIKSEVFHRDYAGSKLLDSSTVGELAMFLARAADASGTPDEARRSDKVVLWARDQGYISSDAIRRIAIERERDGKIFGSFDGQVKNQRLAQLLDAHFGPDHIFSATRLSLYGKCPFKFFVSRVLRMEPRSEAALDLKVTDAGELLHEIMRVFMGQHRGRVLDRSESNLLQHELMRTADEVFDSYEQVVPPLNPHVWKIDREIRKLLLEQVLEYELSVQEKTQAGGLRPMFFELAFGMKAHGDDPRSTEKYLEIARPCAPDDTNEKVRLRGRIDRVDMAPDGTTLAYDYKLSKSANVADMRAGRDLQLGAYLAALEGLFLPEGRLAGGGYYVFKGGSDRRNNGLYRKSYSQSTGINAQVRSNLTDSEWNMVRAEITDRIWEFMDGMRAGLFLVKPSQGKKTCESCDYGAVCRYETYRIRRKVAAGNTNE
jgi:ATP-dependent helicase/DNAse subunit B